MIVSRISLLILSLKDGFPKRSVFVEFGKVNLDTKVSGNFDVRATITGWI